MAPSATWGDVAEIPIDRPSLRAPAKNEIPSDDDMGFNDPDNILYVNMEAPGLGQRFKERMDELEQMLQLTHQLATIHAGIQVRRRKEEGALPTDDSDDSRWRRSQYRSRVMDVYFNDGVYPWMYSPQSSNVDKEIQVEKSRFHWELLAAMLVGIVLPRPLAASLEAIFQGISQTINETNYTADRRSFWSMLQVYTYDEVRDDLRASLRNITYTLDQEMYTTSKTKSTQTTVSTRFTFSQANFAFNERTWKSMQREVEEYIRATGIGNIKDPPNVPV
ncbi:hypothetical protein MHUMG1_10439 [Metarhizium humberi]|uniref:Uncharacterized protein n=1 Tax=Metarhizium humberi TaxID=2596975 RepID=A0A9P8S336_9HYPO|nr:hypothetical protein MHUMG1_10439 [Metarhizium humberi]